MTDAILFDFNGVLVDDEELHRDALARVLETLRLPLSREDYYAHYLGFDDRLCFAEAFRLANRTLPTELLRHLVAQKAKIYEELLGASAPVVPGAADFVRAAADRFRLAIVSGARRAEIDLLLNRMGLANRFEVIVSAEDTPFSKPDPAGLQAARAALDTRVSLAARRCVVIEDSIPGLAAARAAGMACVLLATSHDEDTLRRAGAPVVWETFTGHDPAELTILLT